MTKGRRKSKNRLYVPPKSLPEDIASGKLSAGQLARPPLDISPQDSRPWADGLIRVLDDDGKACGDWNPGLSPEVLLEGLRQMTLVRWYDERMHRMQRAGKISFYMKCRGEEAVAAAAGFALDDGDMLFTSYRQQGLLLARGRTLVEMICQCLSNAADLNKGRQLPVLYCWKDSGFFTISGNLATQCPQAVGYAMAQAYKGEKHITSTWIGDGATAEGDFHSAATFAAVYRAPVILNIVNNQWAISSSQSIAGGGMGTFAARGPSYGIPSLRLDGNDFLAVHAATSYAAERARKGLGPTMLEHVTYRATAHSTSDDPSRYRSGDGLDSWPLGDPIERLAAHLQALGHWSAKQQQQLDRDCKEQVRLAYKEAETQGNLARGNNIPQASLFEDVYADMPWHLREQSEELQSLGGGKT